MFLISNRPYISRPPCGPTLFSKALMHKTLVFILAAAAAASAQAFPAQAGEWVWPHTISWHDRATGGTDGIDNEETLCITPEAAADYPKAQAARLNEENCRISGYQSRGKRASFKASCETMSFDAAYEKLNEDEIQFTQTIYSRKGKSYTAAGTMRRQNGKACTE